jgi:hypothetical protein
MNIQIPAPNPHSRFNLAPGSVCIGNGLFLLLSPRHSSPWLQDPSNNTPGPPGLSVFLHVLRRIPPCNGSSTTQFLGCARSADSLFSEPFSWPARSPFSRIPLPYRGRFLRVAATAIVRNHACEGAA